jgi:hypothetical protein
MENIDFLVPRTLVLKNCKLKSILAKMPPKNYRRSTRSASTKAQQYIRSFFAVVGSKTGQKGARQDKQIEKEPSQRQVDVDEDRKWEVIDLGVSSDNDGETSDLDNVLDTASDSKSEASGSDNDSEHPTLRKKYNVIR